ncbi:MAG TPA: hypothetical protein VHV10_13660, partial [Ktedonobacteraceae bacterium]|nr:hypothetical protein [Ktedonobacteraceae bacterium]
PYRCIFCEKGFNRPYVQWSNAAIHRESTNVSDSVMPLNVIGKHAASGETQVTMCHRYFR